jgi:hypothetical protein
MFFSPHIGENIPQAFSIWECFSYLLYMGENLALTVSFHSQMGLFLLFVLNETFYCISVLIREKKKVDRIFSPEEFFMGLLVGVKIPLKSYRIL